MYRSLVESVLNFNIVVWYDNLGVKGKAKLTHIVGMAGKTIGAKQDSPSDVYLTAVEPKTAGILDDAKHPLLSQFQKLRSGSGRRYKVPIARKNVYKKSIIPSAISVLNSRATEYVRPVGFKAQLYSHCDSVDLMDVSVFVFVF